MACLVAQMAGENVRLKTRFDGEKDQLRRKIVAIEERQVSSVKCEAQECLPLEISLEVCLLCLKLLIVKLVILSGGVGLPR